MSLISEQLLDAVLALPDEERLEVAEAVIASLLPSDQSLLDDCWREVIRRRSAELRSGQVVGIPWEVVKKRACEKAGERPSAKPGSKQAVLRHFGVFRNDSI